MAVPLSDYEVIYDPDSKDIVEIKFRVANKIIWQAKQNGTRYGVKRKLYGVTITCIPSSYEQNNKVVRHFKQARKELATYLKWVSAQIYLNSQYIFLEQIEDDPIDGKLKFEDGK
jgi:hypothetical protein